MFEKPAPDWKRRRAGIAAFSLVEVVLAIGIISIGLIVIAGLLPQGLKFNHDSVEESQAVNLIQALVADRQSANLSNNSPLYNLPALTAITAQTTGTIYVMDDMATTTTQPTNARYRVSYTVYPSSNLYPAATNYPSTSVLQPVYIDFQVSWPAVQTQSPSSVETLATFMSP